MQLLLFLTTGKILAIIIGFIHYKKLSLAFKITLLQVIVAMLAEMYGYYLSVHSNNNLWFFNFYWLIELWLVGWAASQILNSNRIRKIVIYLLAFASAIWLINVYYQGLIFYVTWGISAICITLVIVYFIVLFNNLFGVQRLITDSIFWLSISVLLFYGCLLPYYGLFNFLYNKYPDTLDSFFDITIALDFIRYPLIAFSFYLYGKQQKIQRATEALPD